jgi:Ala-tRNA(Pro) deacylase
MDMAPTLARQLARHGIAYHVINHPRTDTSLNVAHSAHIPEHKMVKPVILEDDQGYVMALVPANQHVKIRELNLTLERHLGLVTEKDISQLFVDCEVGAIPPVGDAYGMDIVVDTALDDCDDVYIEAGNHINLLHLSGHSFRQLVANSRHASICLH